MILFIIPQLSHGGSNKSLESIISIQNFSSNIRIYSLDDNTNDNPYFNIFKRHLIEHGYIYRIVSEIKIIRKVTNALYNYLGINIWGYIYKREVHRIEKKYPFDTVIGFEESYATLFASYFENCKKIAWMHCDYNLYKIYSGNRDEHQLYSKFDKIVAVSKFAKQAFCENFPETEDKVEVIYNLIDVDKVRKLAMEKIEDNRFDTSKFTMVSVGRITEVKQFQMIPKIISEMLSSNKDIDFKWYIIGDGDKNLKEIINEEIKRCKIENHLILLGAKTNPYPYIAQANLLVSTSRTESWSYVINEAKTLHTPVVTVRCGSSDEVIDERTGIIVEMTGLAKTLKSLAYEDEMYRELKSSCMAFEYENEGIKKLVKFFG